LHNKSIVSFIIVFFYCHFGAAQGVEPKGSFLQSETKIGEEIQYALSVKYDKSLNILFPDSLYRFGTFEYISRKYFITKTDSAYSYDSVVYKLSTFETDSVQFLQLPVFVMKGKDSLAIYSKMDSILLIRVLTEIPENLELKTNTALVKVKRQFNYPYFLIALGLLVFIGLVVALFFGRQLLRWWKAYLMQRTHNKFIEKFYNLMRDITGNNPVNTPEHVLAVWKNYLEKLEKKPISKLTTKEILVLHNNALLKDNLKIIDRSIYGGEKGNDLFASFDYLMRFSVEIYNEKIRELKQG
jgi:hypothetical protein